MSAILLLENVTEDAAERYRRGGIYELSPDERDEKADEEAAKARALLLLQSLST